MPHMPDAKEPLPLWITVRRHAKPDPKDQSRLGLGPAAQAQTIVRTKAKGRDRVAAIGAISDVQCHWAIRAPCLAGRPDRFRQTCVTMPDGFDPFGVDHVQRPAQAINMVGGRCATEILIGLFGLRTHRPIPIPRHAGVLRRDRLGLVVEKDKAQTGRHHQALLAAGDRDIDTPCIHFEPVAGQGGDAIRHQQCRVADSIQRSAQQGGVIADRC